MTKPAWHYIDTETSTYIGIFEFKLDENDEDEDYKVFELLQVKDKAENNHKIVFGDFCNTGILQSGYFTLDDSRLLDENLHELMEELRVYYSDGYEATNNIICNDRM